MNQPESEASTLLDDAKGALDKLVHRELQLIKESEELFKRQVDHMKLIDRLQNYVPNMDKIEMDTKRLNSLVESSSALVEEVCGKFRKIDAAKARADDCLVKIGDILDLKTCREGMSKAMEVENYEEAAMLIKRFLSIDQKELNKTIHLLLGIGQNLPDSHPLNADLVDLETTSKSLNVLEQARKNLLRLCQDNFTKAIESNNPKDIVRFFKIFPMLNEHILGLTIYAEYLQSKITIPKLTQPEASTSSANKPKTNVQADKLAGLYEMIAKLIQEHQPLIETYYGPGHLIVVIRYIQKSCDILSRKVLEEFRNETKLQSIAKMVRSHSLVKAANAQTMTTSTNLQLSSLDPRLIDTILNEISLIISRSEVYLNFIVQKVKDDFEAKISNETEKQSSLQQLYNLIFIDCELNHLIQEVGGIYVMLEQFYLNESAKKAILVDQIDAESSSYLISSMLDDIFFIIKKCTKRSVSTKSNEVFCAIINHCTTLLESTFCRVLEDRLKNQQYYSTVFTTKNLDLSQAYNAIQSSRYLQSSRELETSKAQYFSALNNLDRAIDYIQTLRGMLESDVKKLRPSLLVTGQRQDNQIEKSISCLNELTQLVTRFGSIINSSLYQLFNSLLRQRLRLDLRTLLSENPELMNILKKSPSEMSNLAQNMLTTLDKSLKESLTHENYSKLTGITREFLASSLSAIK